MAGFFVKTLYGPKQFVADTQKLLNQATGGRIPNDVDLYCNVFEFGPDLETVLQTTGGSLAGMGNHPVGVRWLTWDIDANDVESAVAQARELYLAMNEIYGVQHAVAFNLSGSRGVHVRLMLPEPIGPSDIVPTAARVFCESLAKRAGITSDVAIYTPTHVIRLPNSLNQKSGRFAAPVRLGELMEFAPKAVAGLAACQRPMTGHGWENDWPPHGVRQFQMDWQQATEMARHRKVERVAYESSPRHGLPLEIERWFTGGFPKSDGRKIALFRAAAALGELFGPGPQAEQGILAILQPIGRSIGLADGMATKQITDGIRRGTRGVPDEYANLPAPECLTDQTPVNVEYAAEY